LLPAACCSLLVLGPVSEVALLPSGARISPPHALASSHFVSEISRFRCARDLGGERERAALDRLAYRSANCSHSAPWESGSSAASLAHSPAFSFPEMPVSPSGHGSQLDRTRVTRCEHPVPSIHRALSASPASRPPSSRRGSAGGASLPVAFAHRAADGALPAVDTPCTRPQLNVCIAVRRPVQSPVPPRRPHKPLLAGQSDIYVRVGNASSWVCPQVALAGPLRSVAVLDSLYFTQLQTSTASARLSVGGPRAD